MEELIYNEINKVKTEAYLHGEIIKREMEEKSKQDIVFAIMGEQIRIACQLIGLLSDNVISEITGVSVSHLQCMKN